MRLVFVEYPAQLGANGLLLCRIPFFDLASLQLTLDGFT